MPTLTPARLTDRAKVERKDANSYYNYGESRHYSKDCPQPKIKKERINAIDEGDENEPDTSSLATKQSRPSTGALPIESPTAFIYR